MKKLLTLLFTLTLFASLQAHAFKSGDWVLSDSNPENPDVGVCQAVTAGYMGNSVVYLSLVVDKTGARPLEILLTPKTGSIGATAMYAKTRSGKTFYLPLLPKNGDRDQYWNIPTDTETFVRDLRAANQVNFYAVSGSRYHLPLSLAGSNAVINEMQRRCAKNSLYTAQEFERAFLPENKDSFDIRNITPEKAAQLRELVKVAVPAYRKLLGIQQELLALEDHFAGLTRERSQLRADLERLKDTEVPNLISAKEEAMRRIDQATAEIADLEAQIAARQQELAAAQAAAAAAYEVLRPLVPEHDRLLSQRRADEQRLTHARAYLADLEASLSRAQQLVRSLNGEADQLRWALTRAQDEVRRAQIGFDNANRAYQAFHPQREVQERIQRNPRLAQLRQEFQQLQSQAQNLRAQVQAKRAEVQQRQQALNRCERRAFEDREIAAEGPVRPGVGPERPNRPGRPGPGNPGGPGRPGRPGEGDDDGAGPGRPGRPGPGNPDRPRPPRPTPPTPPSPPAPPSPPPAPDCSAERNALQSARQELNRAEAQLNQVESRIQANTREREDVRERIQQNVRQQQNELAQAVNQWQAALRRSQLEESRIADRLDNLLRYDLPRAQSELHTLESRRPSALSEVASAEAALSYSSSAYANYKRQVNYDAIKAEADRTAREVSRVEQGIAQLRNGVSARQKLVRDQTALRDSLEQRIADSYALIAQKEARLVEVDASLALYDQQKAEIQARIDGAAAELKAISDQFGANLN